MSNQYHALALGGLLLAGPAGAAQVFVTDVIVQGSECVGIDCSSSESFGFDTLRLKENNLRVHFDDTSTSASFPSNDWRITINDSGNGGASYFSIDDATAGRSVFKIEAGAPANALRVDSAGNIGIGDDNPVVELHVTDGDSPTLRLEQDGSSGFTPQTWDIAGNETNFFIRDVTNGSKLSFRIKPGAPKNSIFIAADGDVGMGTENPSTALHVQRSDGTASLLVEETSTTNASRDLLTLTNNGNPQIRLQNSSLTDNWQLGLQGSSLSLQNNPLTAGLQITSSGSVFLGNFPTGVFSLQIDDSGNGVFRGTVAGGSSRDRKENFTPIDTAEILEAVGKLDISRWKYKQDPEGVTHLGPMAEDFHQAFGLGPDNKHIGMLDSGGVALAAIQGLLARQRAKEQQLEQLAERLAAREQRLEMLSLRLEHMEQRLARVASERQATQPVSFCAPSRPVTAGL